MVARTELTDLALMTPEAIVVGLGLKSCDVVIEMPSGTLRIAGPIVKPLSVTAVLALLGTQPDVMVSTMLVSVGAALVAAALLAIATVGVADEAKNPLG